MGFVANFIRFLQYQNFENQLRYDKVTESLKAGTFLRHSVGGGPQQLEHKQEKQTDTTKWIWIWKCITTLHSQAESDQTNLKYKISELDNIDALVTSQRQCVVHFLRSQPSLMLTLYLIDTHRHVNHRLRSFLDDVVTVGVRWMIVLDILFNVNNHPRRSHFSGSGSIRSQRTGSESTSLEADVFL